VAKNQMNKIIHRASDRVVNDLGWLRIHASFRPECKNDHQRQFGTLLVVDDATMIPGGRGFKLHPHDNMEIISWVLSGTDEHNDDVNGITLLGGGDVQLMSAGTGIQHAENNYSNDDGVHMFQIWIQPLKMNIAPRYQVKSIADLGAKGKLCTFISPDPSTNSLVINQRAYLSLLVLDEQMTFTYKPFEFTNGVYVLIVMGSATIDDNELADRDAVAIFPGQEIDLRATKHSKILFIEVPMKS
jgi:redox-sensitive bicupin YhaK (pirin superfamily)